MVSGCSMRAELEVGDAWAKVWEGRPSRRFWDGPLREAQRAQHASPQEAALGQACLATPSQVPSRGAFPSLLPASVLYSETVQQVASGLTPAHASLHKRSLSVATLRAAANQQQLYSVAQPLLPKQWARPMD